MISQVKDTISSLKYKFWMMMHTKYKLSPQFVSKRLGISKSTFYRKKQRLVGKLVKKKR
tara:strand:- start:4164 stop:4340 length:177 start_codon:yes stop_codon:yes gene_type:complete